METHLLPMMLDTEEDKFSKNVYEFINIVRRLKLNIQVLQMFSRPDLWVPFSVSKLHLHFTGTLRWYPGNPWLTFRPAHFLSPVDQ